MKLDRFSSGQLDAEYLVGLRQQIILFIVIALLLLLGLNNSFIQDDAYISFRYAENLISGHGLTWNVGDDRIEGFSNFLWVILIACVEAIGIDPVTSGMVFSLLSAAGSLYFTYRLSTLILGSKWYGIVAMTLLGTNYTYSSYMTGGLETQLQTFLIVASTYLSFHLLDGSEAQSKNKLLLLSALFSLATLTRLDSLLVCSVLFVFVVTSLCKTNASSPPHDRGVLVGYLTLPAALIIGAYFLIKYFYYGDIFPNTFYLKAGGLSIESIERGLSYVWIFSKQYFLLPILLAGIFLSRKIASNRYINTIIIILGLWILYVIKIGGDFMEFRFFVPVLPFLFILIAKILQLTKYSVLKVAMAMLLFSGSIYHAMTFAGENGIESISQLNAHIVGEDQNWRGVGVALSELFSGADDSVTIAVTAAGAIPYYSKLRTVDMLGINDKWIAKNGANIGSLPGHTRIAPLEYLQKQNVNIIVGHPKIVPVNGRRDGNLRSFFWVPPNLSLLPQDAKFIEVPISPKYNVQLLYIKENDHIDMVINKYGLRAYR